MSRNLLLGASAIAIAAGIATASPASADPSVYLPAATAPTGGIWVQDGTGPAKGHLWISDHLQGFCRLNPDATNTSAVLQTNGCKVADGQPAYDPVNKLAFVPDGSAKSVGVMRLKLNAAALFNGGQTNFNQALPVADKRCKGNTLGGCRPTAAAWVPTANGRGDLYIAVKRNGNIYRLRNVANGSPGIGGAPSALQLVATADGAQSLTFVGNDLYIAEATAVTRIQDPSNNVPAAVDGLGLCNNNNVCVGEDLGFGFLAPLSVGSDGTNLFVGDAGNPLEAVHIIDPVNFIDSVIPGLYLNVSGFAFAPDFTDPVTLATRPARIFWADDVTGGAGIQQGHWYSTEAAGVLPTP